MRKEDLISAVSESAAKGDITLKELLDAMPALSRNCDFANLDHFRRERCGFPEFVFGEGKTPEQLLSISGEIADSKQPLLITRLPEQHAEKLLEKFPDAEFDRLAKTLLLLPEGFTHDKGKVLIITAGTTDLPVALEAKHTLTACGCGVEMAVDSGVAGLHRVISNLPLLKGADVIIVAAGMEGALPSVVGGLVSCPVIALPTSVGYGTALGGMTALFSMLNSCANGITVTNIDNGFGAGCAAARIIRTCSKRLS